MLWAWYPSVISSCQLPVASSFAPSLLAQQTVCPRQSLHRRDVSLSCNPEMVWVSRSFTSGGELHLSPQCPYASSVLSAGCRSCERGDQEENLSCLFPVVLLCPCNLLLLPNSLFSASSIPNTFTSLIFAWLIAFLFYLSVSCHFSLFFHASPHSQFQVLSFFSLFVLFGFFWS